MAMLAGRKSALDICLACVLITQCVGLNADGISVCPAMGMGEITQMKMVQYPNSPTLVLGKTGWLGSDLVNEVMNRLILSHQRCPCPWTTVGSGPSAKQLVGGLTRSNNGGLLDSTNSSFFASKVTLTYDGATSSKANFLAQKSDLETQKTGMTAQKNAAQSQLTDVNTKIDDPSYTSLNSTAKQALQQNKGTLAAKVAKLTAGIAGLDTGIGKVQEGISLTISLLGALKPAYDKSVAEGTNRCNMFTVQKDVGMGVERTPSAVGKGVDFAVCWDGKGCVADPGRGQISGGELGLSTTHKWLVPKYFNNTGHPLKGSFPDVVSGLKADTSLIASSGVRFLALQSHHKCHQHDSTSLPGYETGCLPVAPPLPSPMSGKGCTFAHLCTNLDQRILNASGLASLTVELLDEDALVVELATLLRGNKNFILHAPDPSYITANYMDRLTSIPIPTKAAVTTGPAKAQHPAKPWFPTIKATIVYSSNFQTLASAAHTKCGDTDDATAVATANFEGCRAPWPKTLLEDLNEQFKDGWGRLVATPSVNPDDSLYSSDLSLLLDRASGKMTRSLDRSSAIYGQIITTQAVIYLQNSATVVPAGLGLTQVVNPYKAAHKFPRTLDLAWPQHLNIAVYDKCEPFAICPQGNATASVNVSGLAVEHIMEVLKMVGYNQPTQYTFRCVSDQNQLVELARKNMLDIGTGCISASAERMQIVRFASSFFSSGLGIMTVKEEVVQSMFSFFEPFTLRMWMMVLGLGAAYGIFMNLFERLHNRDNFPFPVLSLPGLLDANLYGISQLLQDGGEKALSQYSGRFLKVTFQFLVMVIMTVYTGQVTATLTVGALSGSISVSSDLNGKLVLTPPEDSYAYKYVKEKLPGAIVNAYPSYDLNELAARLKEGHEQALVYNYHQLNFFANEQADCSLLVPSQEIGFGFEEYAIMTPYDSPLESSLREVVGFRMAGNLDKSLVDPYMEDKCAMEAYYNIDPLAPITVEGYYGLTVMFAGVACICIGLWIFENKLF